MPFRRQMAWSLWVLESSGRVCSYPPVARHPSSPCTPPHCIEHTSPAAGSRQPLGGAHHRAVGAPRQRQELP